MRVLAVHGLGHQEKNPTSWQPLWEKTLQDVLRKWNESLGVEVRFAEYDDLFGDTPMTVGGTVGGFGRLLWDEVRYSVTDRISGSLEGGALLARKSVKRRSGRLEW